jgi:diacylglycerol kinase (ATP)
VRVVHRGDLVRATLVYNPKAGQNAAPSRRRLLSSIEALGWRVKAIGVADLDRDLARPGDAVLVAGGDGTVERVVRHLRDAGIPLGVIPMGTANNIARTLGIGLDPRAAIAGLRSAEVREVDMGRVGRGRAYREHFVEGFGVGLLASVIATRSADKGKKGGTLRRVFRLIAEKLEGFASERARIELDGRDVSGEYLLACAMNLRSLGPALMLAPDARFDDGLLDVVVVRPEHRESLLAHLKRAARIGEAPLPQFEVHRVKSMRLSGSARWAHLDDRACAFEGDVEVGVERRALKFLLPPRDSLRRSLDRR